MGKLIIYYRLMKYFTELLESYSKLKKRKLRLLSEADVSSGQDGEALAQKYIKAASPNNGGQRIKIEGTKAEIWAQRNQKEYKLNPTSKEAFTGKYMTSVFHEGTVEVTPGTQGYKRFVDYFNGKEPGDEKMKVGNDPNAPKQTQQNQEAPPEYVGGSIQANSGIFENPEDMLKAIDNLRSAAKETDKVHTTLRGLTSGLAKILKNISANDFRTYFFGKRKGSLEYKIAESKVFKLQANTDASGASTGDFSLVELPQSSKTVLDWTETMKELFGALSKGRKGIVERADFFRNTFALNDDGSVTIYSDKSSNEGVVVQSDILYEILDNVNEDVLKNENDVGKGGDLQINFIKKIASPGFDNFVRGTLLEEVAVLFSITNREVMARRIGNNEEADKWSALRQRRFNTMDFRQKLARLSSLREAWTSKAQEYSLTTEEQAELAALDAFLGSDKNGTQNLLKASKMIHSRLKKANPYVILHYGTSVGFGRKRDTLEIYNEPGEGRVKVKKENLGAEAADYMDLLPDEVYIESQSYKHYLDSGSNVSIQGGEVSLNSTLNFVIQGRDQIVGNDERRAELRRYLEKRMIGGSGATQSLVKFASEIDSTIKKLTDVTENNVIPGTERSTNRAAELISSIEKTINANFDKKERLRFSKGLSAKLAKYKTASEEDKPKIRAKIVSHVTSLVGNLSIHKAIQGDGEDSAAAKNLLTAKFINAGAGTDPGLSTHVRILGDVKDRKYQFSQNKIIDFACSVIQKGHDKYEVSFENDNWVIRDKQSKKSIIRLDTEYSGSSPKDIFSYNEKCIKELGNEIGLKMDEKTSDVNDTLELLLENQKKIFQELFRLQKESILKG